MKVIASKNLVRKTIGVCESQPVTAEGLRAVLRGSDLEFLSSTDGLPAGAELARVSTPDVMIVDKSFGIQLVLHWISDRRAERPDTQIVVWGASMTQVEALRFLQAGARGIIRKTCNLLTLLECLRAVSCGTSWMDDSVFRDTAAERNAGSFAGRVKRNSRSYLTRREQQVVELVEQGLTNREIAHELGIRPGTVKIHLKHIFEKTGVRGRYGLALSVLRDKSAMELAPAS
jgi:DNA-binding NarL/FixJ family response regulator